MIFRNYNSPFVLDVDIRYMDILVRHTRRMVFMVTTSRWISTTVDMFPTILEGRSGCDHGHARG